MSSIIHDQDAAATPETLTDVARSAEQALDIEGMTCASCVGRVERKLRKVPGVREVAAAITLVKGDLEKLPLAIELSRATMRVIRQNLFCLRRRYEAQLIRKGMGGTTQPTVADPSTG